MTDGSAIIIEVSAVNEHLAWCSFTEEIAATSFRIVGMNQLDKDEPAGGLSYYAGGAGLCRPCSPAHRWPRESAGVQRGRAGRGAERDPADAVWRH